MYGNEQTAREQFKKRITGKVMPPFEDPFRSSGCQYRSKRPAARPQSR